MASVVTGLGGATGRDPGLSGGGISGGGPALVTFLYSKGGSGGGTVNPDAKPIITGVDPNEIANATLGKIIPYFMGGKARIGAAGIVYGPNIVNGMASFGVSLGFPLPVDGNRKVYAIAFDSKKAWEDAAGFNGAGTPTSGFISEAFTFRFYQGTLTQSADALEIAEFGASNAVAYRPQMLLFFENLPLAQFGGKVPYVAAVIGDVTDGADPDDGINLGLALERLAYSPFIGMTSDEFETDGITDVAQAVFAVEDEGFLEYVQNLNRIYRSWDIIQTDKLRVRDRGANVTPDIVLDRTRIIGGPEAVVFTRERQEGIARELELITPDPDADFVLVPAKAQRPRDPVAVTSSVGKETVTLPVVMDASTRMALVTYAKYEEEQARKKCALTSMIYGLELEPGDLFKLENIASGIEDEVFKVLTSNHNPDWTNELEAQAVLRCALATQGTGEHVQCYADAISADDTYTLSGADFGVANAERRIVVGINLTMAATGQTITDVTIGGVSATEAVVASNTGQGLISAIWYAQVPTGATGDIVINTSGNFTQVSIHVYRAVSASFAVSDTDNDQATTSGAVTVDVDIPANGMAVAVAATRVGASFTWGGDGAIENCTFVNDATTTGQKSAASYNAATAQTAFEISVDPSSSDRVTIAAAAFAL